MVLQFVREAGATFDDRLLAIMGKAYGAVRQGLHDTGQPDIVYEIIARRIIDAAKKGERDPTDNLRKALRGEVFAWS